ncbi:MAG: META domain-containing protein [Chloroflexi bacterium]|nr:META domain-containing protein [Chloroflexota bacterium]
MHPIRRSATTATVPATELAGTEWILASLNGRSPLPNTRLTLTFNEREVSGFSGCNWYGGAYTTGAAGSLTIPEIASTARDCPEIDGVLAQESAFQEALRTAASYHLQTDRLEISSAAGDATLVFEPKAQFDMDPADLVGTAWQLTAWDGHDLLPDTEITLIFDDAETMSGFAGCRHYNGRYTATGDDIRFPMMSMVESNCTQPDPVLIQEGNFTTALSETSNYQLADGQLILYTDPGAILRFAPRAETLETATPAPSFPVGAVHTPQDVVRHFDEWPSEHKQRLSDELLVIFTYPHPLGDWVGGALIYDVPSVSAIVLDFNGRFNPDLTHYKDEAGQVRLEEILADANLMQELQDEVVSRWLNPGSTDSLSAPVTPEPTPTATPLPAPPPPHPRPCVPTRSSGLPKAMPCGAAISMA